MLICNREMKSYLSLLFRNQNEEILAKSIQLQDIIYTLGHVAVLKKNQLIDRLHEFTESVKVGHNLLYILIF